MDSREELLTEKGKAPNIPRASATQPARSTPALQDFLFRPPERERGAAPSLGKPASPRKRQHSVASQEAATTPIAEMLAQPAL